MRGSAKGLDKILVLLAPSNIPQTTRDQSCKKKMVCNSAKQMRKHFPKAKRKLGPAHSMHGHGTPRGHGIARQPGTLVLSHTAEAAAPGLRALSVARPLASCMNF